MRNFPAQLCDARAFPFNCICPYTGIDATLLYNQCARVPYLKPFPQSQLQATDIQPCGCESKRDDIRFDRRPCCSANSSERPDGRDWDNVYKQGIVYQSDEASHQIMCTVNRSFCNFVLLKTTRLSEIASCTLTYESYVAQAIQKIKRRYRK